MYTRLFALVVGIVYVLVGIFGFIDAMVSDPPASPALEVDQGYGLLLGLFPINVLHNIVHLLVGLLGLVSYRRYREAVLFARGLAVFYAVLAILGLLPDPINTTFGLIPIFSHDIWLHALTAVAAAYFGWLAPREEIVADTAVRA